MVLIIVTGTPGTGKTKLSKVLSKKLGFFLLEGKKLIEKYALCEDFDSERNCAIVDEKKLVKALLEEYKVHKDLVFDSHMSYFVPKKYVSLCIVTKSELKELSKRLSKRGYSKLKISENLEAEAFDVCLNEAKEAGHNVLVVDTTTNYNILDIVNYISVSLSIPSFKNKVIKKDNINTSKITKVKNKKGSR